jgi:hypothetical protein
LTADEGVDMKISITKRAPNLLWLLVGLLLGALIMSADLAAGRHEPKPRPNSTAAFLEGLKPLAFKCEYVSSRDGERIHDYVCGIRLRQLLVRNGSAPTDVDGWKGIAAPDQFSCKPDAPNDPAAVGDPSRYRCSYRHGGNRHLHTFTADEIVSTSETDADQADESKDNWYPPHR